MRHRFCLAAVVGAAVLVVGCGQTDYATQVGSSGATLNATITTLDQQSTATYWFQYWRTATPSETLETTHRTVTATGPFSASVGSLPDGTEFQYRLCGSEGDSKPVCAQTRRFTTGRDSLQAWGRSQQFSDCNRQEDVYDPIDFDVVDGPGGASGAAFVRWLIACGGGLDFELGSHSAADITCFQVSGSVAVVGFQVPGNPDPNDPEPGQVFVQAVDGGPAGSGKDSLLVKIDDFPPGQFERPNRSDCSPLGPASAGVPLRDGDVAVNDAR
jgi:hypothetical protein